MKKLINDRNAVSAEALEGLVLSFPHLLRKVAGCQGVIRAASGRSEQVAVITGGGSGHEPMFAGYVGPGIAHAAIAGNVFTSPPPMPIYKTAVAAHQGRGVLFVYGNYAGDVLNFDAAAEMLREDGIQVASIQVTDDVASAPFADKSKRRGIAGDLLVLKVAGACAEEGGTLSEVEAAARMANEHTRTIGVALSSCTIPASGKTIFTLGDNEIEVGMGIHGEPGVLRTSMSTADEIVSQLLERIAVDAPMQPGEEVAIIINGLGATPVLELYIVARSVASWLQRKGIVAAKSLVGNYATSLDMAGCSITVMKLDEQLKRWLFADAETPTLTVVNRR